jgi:hypothetical protein
MSWNPKCGVTRFLPALGDRSLQRAHSGARVGAMDHMPEDMEAVQACLEGIHRNVSERRDQAPADSRAIYDVSDRRSPIAILDDRRK